MGLVIGTHADSNPTAETPMSNHPLLLHFPSSRMPSVICITSNEGEDSSWLKLNT